MSNGQARRLRGRPAGAWRDTLDKAVDMYGKLLDRHRKLVEARLDDMLKAQRRPSTGSAVLLDRHDGVTNRRRPRRHRRS